MAHPPSIFAVMITHYCRTQEDALKQAKRAGKEPGCYYGGITLPNGKRGFAVYKNGKLVENYVVIKGSFSGLIHHPRINL